MNLAKMVEPEQFKDFITKSDAVFQPNWKNIFGSPLNGAVLVSVFNAKKSTRFVDNTFENAEEMIPANDKIDDKDIDEENAFFDSSVSVFGTTGGGDVEDIAFQYTTLSITCNSSSDSKASGRTISLKRVDGEVSGIAQRSPAKSAQNAKATIPRKQSLQRQLGNASADFGNSTQAKLPDIKPNSSHFMADSKKNSQKIDYQPKASGSGTQRARTNEKRLAERRTGVGGRNQQCYEQNRNNSRPQNNSYARRNNTRCYSAKNGPNGGNTEIKQQPEFRKHDRNANDTTPTHDNVSSRRNPFRRHGLDKAPSKPEK